MRELALCLGEEAIFTAAGLTPVAMPSASPSGAPSPIGFIPSRDEGSFGVGLPFGRIEAEALASLADLCERFGDGSLRTTPWRALLSVASRPRMAETLSRDSRDLGLIADSCRPPPPHLCLCRARRLPKRKRRCTPPTRAASPRRCPASATTFHVSGCVKGCAHRGPAALTLVGNNGRYDLVRDGSAADQPVLTGLSIEQASPCSIRTGGRSVMTASYDYAARRRRDLPPLLRHHPRRGRSCPASPRMRRALPCASSMLAAWSRSPAISSSRAASLSAARSALLAGKPILCDSKMVANGVTRAGLPAGNEVICTLDAPGIADLAADLGTTRSAAALDLWRDRLDGALVAIGNAPTALFRLLELIEAGAPKPAAIIGMPVGFVGAAESKEALAAYARVPFLIVKGRKGGSAMAVAAVNALASEAE